MGTNILIAGGGNYGSWWASSCLLLGNQVEITVFDPYKNNINLIKKRFDQLNKKNISLTKIDYLDNINKINDDYHICIIACNSIERPDLICQLSNLIKPKYWIIEKVIACSSRLLNEIKENLKNNIVLVSHPRRMQPLWHMAKLELWKVKKISEINQFVGEWELLSNSFHFADIICWCFETNISEVITKDIINWRESYQREGYQEAEGSITIIYSNNIKHKIIKSYKKENYFDFYINSNPKEETTIITVDEINGTLLKGNKVIGNCDLYDWSYLCPYFIFELIKGNILLPLFDDVLINHDKLISAFNSRWKEVSLNNKNIKIS
mgnify:CR=1 FL=1